MSFSCRSVDYEIPLEHHFISDISKHFHLGLPLLAGNGPNVGFGNTFLAETNLSQNRISAEDVNAISSLITAMASELA